MGKSGKAFFWILAALAGVGIWVIEIGVIFIEVLFGYDPTAMDFQQIMLHWCITCALWAIAVFILYVKGKNKGFDLLSFRDKPLKQAWFRVLPLLFFVVAVSYVAWGNQLKPLAELNGKLAAYGNKGIAAFVMQYIYYLFEMALGFLCICFAQKAWEDTFSGNGFPGGGLFFGLTWGLFHIPGKGWLAGVLLALNACIYGVAYLYLKKNTFVAYGMIWLMFVL